MASITHINTSDVGGGCARDSRDIHEGLDQRGHESRMLVGSKQSDDPRVEPIGAGRTSELLAGLANKVMGATATSPFLHPSALTVPRHEWVRGADVVQVYNLHGGYVSPLVLPAISGQTPIVWRLCDMWPFTGGCIYSYECERWRTGCGKCPHLEEYPSMRWDTTALLWRVKDHLYQRSDITVVAPSKWLKDQAAESPLLGRFPTEHIPNGIDTDLFSPEDPHDARSALGLPGNRKVVYLGAHSLEERRKGAHLVPEVLDHLPAGLRDDLLLLTAGSGEPPEELRDRVAVRHLGYVEDDRRLAQMYSSADVTLFPSLADNLPNAVLESLACGTPVSAFEVGGVPEALADGDAGELAPAGDTGALADGLGVLLRDDVYRKEKGARGREHVEQTHTLSQQAQRFEALYADIGVA